MAKQVFTNVAVTFGTANTVISQYVSSVTLSTTAAEVATTAMGSSAVTRIQGLIDNSVTLELHQDFPTIEFSFQSVFLKIRKITFFCAQKNPEDIRVSQQ